MKIYLSKYWRQSSLFNLCMLILFAIVLIVFCIWYYEEDGGIVVVFFLSLGILSFGGILLGSKRFLTYAVVENHQIHSYSVFSKKLCTVTTSLPTYYKIFSTPQGMNTAKFIVISNEPFEYRETYSFAKVRFIQHYDTAKQIVLPLNDEVVKLLNLLEEWHKVT